MPIAHRKRKYLKGALFSTTALALLTTADAEALIIDETLDAPGGDFSDSFPGDGFVMDDGTLSITGDLEFLDRDFIQITGLQPGGTFDFDLALESPFVEGSGGDQFYILDSEEGTITVFPDTISPVEASGLIPADGIIIIVGENTPAQEGGFSLSGTAPAAITATPEPASTAALGAGALALAGLRRRKKKR